MRKIIIIGSSGHSKVIIDIIECEKRYKIAGLLDPSRKIGENTLGYKVLGKEEDLPALIKKHSLHGVIVAIGDNFKRADVVARIAKICPDLPFVSAVHPAASIAKGCFIRGGTVIMAGVRVNPCCNIGRFCILNTNSSLDHDSTMNDFSSLAPGVVTGGNCNIGAYSAVSIGAVLVHNISIGEHTVIGAGATVLDNIGSYKLAFGSPAKVIKDRAAGDEYL